MGLRPSILLDREGVGGFLRVCIYVDMIPAMPLRGTKFPGRCFCEFASLPLLVCQQNDGPKTDISHTGKPKMIVPTGRGYC